VRAEASKAEKTGLPLKRRGRSEVAKHRVATFAGGVGRRLAVPNVLLIVAPNEFLTVRSGLPEWVHTGV
jgi:hypothetical protein